MFVLCWGHHKKEKKKKRKKIEIFGVPPIHKQLMESNNGYPWSMDKPNV
jgi:hypothetical protein